MSVSVTRITPEPLTAAQVSMANAAEVVRLLITLFGEQSLESDARPILVNGSPAWQITIRQPGYIDQIANIEDWIVLGQTGPGGPRVVVYPNHVFLKSFTANTPLVWAPTSSAPTATAGAGGSAELSFPQPTSPNGPWTYTVSQTNTTTSTTGQAVLSGNPVVADGNVILTVDGLTNGDSYTFTATVSTQYAGVTATSLASNSITATS